MNSVAYSPDGRHIISGSDDQTIRIWDAETGTAVGNTLKGHTYWVKSVAYSPCGLHIISGSSDGTIRIWSAETGAAVSKSLVGDVVSVQSVAYPSDEQCTVPGSLDETTHVDDSLSYLSIRPSSCNPIHPALYAMPCIDGWVRDSEGGLLYWVPHDIRETVHSPALLTIPLTSRNRSVSLDFDNFAFGTSWTQIFQSAAC